MAFNCVWVFFCWWPTPGSKWVYNMHYTGTAFILLAFALSTVSGRLVKWMEKQMGIVQKGGTQEQA